MSAREDVIAEALLTRLEAVRARLGDLKSDQFGNDASYVAQLKQAIAECSPDTMSMPQVMDQWIEAGGDCLEGLRRLSLGVEPLINEAQAPTASPNEFLESLAANRSDAGQRVALLTKRYACPINFSAATEEKIREHVLTRLMVQDRSKIERETIDAVDATDLLLKLNLIAIHAARTSDLRFLDALNYYYELLPANWVPRARHAWLAASFPGLYARALAGQILRHHIIAHSDTREHTARGATYLQGS